MATWPDCVTTASTTSLTPTKRIYSVEDVFYGIKPVLASGYIAALGYLGVLATRWVWVVTLAEVTEVTEVTDHLTGGG